MARFYLGKADGRDEEILAGLQSLRVGIEAVSAPLEQLPPSSALRQLYQELNTFRAALEDLAHVAGRAPSASDLAALGVRIDDVALAPSLADALESLPPSAALRQLYQELNTFRSALADLAHVAGRAPSASDLAALRVRIDDVALAPSLADALESLPPNAALRQIYDELNQIRGQAHAVAVRLGALEAGEELDRLRRDLNRRLDDTAGEIHAGLRHVAADRADVLREMAGMFGKADARDEEILAGLQSLRVGIEAVSAPLEQLPPSSALRQLYQELNTFRAALEDLAHVAGRAPSASDLAALGVRIDDVALAPGLADGLESLPPNAALRQIYDELTQINGQAQGVALRLGALEAGEELDRLRCDLNRRLDDTAGEIHAGLRHVAADRADVLREIVALRSAVEGRLPFTAAPAAAGGLSAPLATALAALTQNLNGGADSAVSRVAPAPIERLHGSLELMRQGGQPAARFATPAGASPFAGGAWRRISGLEHGGWRGGYRIRGLASLGPILYASVTCPTHPDDIGIWSWDGRSWRQAADARRHPGLVNSEINGLASDGSAVYGLSSGGAGGLWRLQGDEVELLTSESPTGAYCLTLHEGAVVYGGDPAEIYRYQDGQA